MEILILKTNVKNKIDFKKIKNLLFNTFKINECTIDLEDKDKVLRILGDELKIENIVNKVKEMGYYCEELDS